MAKVKVDTGITGMSSVDSKVGKTIFQGVQDNSTAIGIGAKTSLIEGVGKLGIAAYQGEALANVESEVQKGIVNPIVDHRTLAGEVSSLGTILGKQIGAGASEEVTNPVRIKLDDTLKKYNTAVEQGIMSTADLNNRTLEVLRKVVARNPSMTRELINTANHYLEMSGVAGIIKQEESAAESAAKARKGLEDYILSIAKAKNIPIPLDKNGGVEWENLKEQTDDIQKQDAVIEALGRGIKVTEDQVAKQGPTYTRALTRQTVDFVTKHIEQQAASGKPWSAEDIFTIKQAFLNIEQTFLSTNGVSSIQDSPVVKAQLDNIRRFSESMIESISGLKSGKDTAEYIKNQVAIMDNEQQIAVMKMVNRPQLAAFNGVIQAMGWANVVSYDPELAAEISMDAAKLINGFPTNSNKAYSPTNVMLGKYKGKSAALASVAAVLDQIKNTEDEVSQGTLDALTNSARAINMDLASDTLDSQTKYRFQHSYVEEISKNTNKEAFKKVPREAKEEMVKQVSVYTRLQGQNLDVLANDILSKGGTLSIGVDPSTGYLMIDTKKSSSNVSLNPYVKDTLKNINKGMEAYYNLSEYPSKKEAAKMFYKQSAVIFGGVTQ